MEMSEEGKDARQLPRGWTAAKLAEWMQPVHAADPGLEPEQAITYFDISSIDNESGLERFNPYLR